METLHAVNGGPTVQLARQTVDPAVTRVKFDRELAQFRKLERYHQERGILLRRSEFPQLVFVFVAPRVRPAAILFGVKFDFTNYPVEAISVEFIDPLTEAPLRIEQMPTRFPRKSPPVAFHVEQPDGAVQTHFASGPPQELIQFHPPHNKPFLCLPGTREYHNHSAHSNDSWQLRQSRGEGSLGFLLDQFYTYGSAPIAAYVPNLVPQGVDEHGRQQIMVNGVTFGFSNISE